MSRFVHALDENVIKLVVLHELFNCVGIGTLCYVEQYGTFNYVVIWHAAVDILDNLTRSRKTSALQNEFLQKSAPENNVLLIS